MLKQATANTEIDIIPERDDGKLDGRNNIIGRQSIAPVRRANLRARDQDQLTAPPPVDVEDVARDEGRFVRGDEDDRIGLLVDLRICLRAVLPGSG
jgi:hypothetical protein